MKDVIKLKKKRSFIFFNKDNFLVGFLQITRLHSGIQAVAYLLLSIYLVNHQMNFTQYRVIIGGLVVILVVAFGFIVDDIRDLAIDKIVKPNNAIPSGRISYQSAIILAILFGVCSILGASILGIFLFIITLVNIFTCLSYAYFLRNIVILRSFSVAYLNSSIIIFGSAIAGEITVLTGIVSFLIFLFTCAQELLYAVVDHDVDQTYNFPTSATVLGIKKSLKLSILFLLLVIIVTVCLGIVAYKSTSFEILMFPCIILPLFLALIRMCKSSAINNINYVIKILYFTRFLSFLALWSL